MSRTKSKSQGPLWEAAYDVLLREIMTGALPPGTPLRESRLSSALGISRTPLREALFRLEREGLVFSDLDKGYAVKPLTEREIREIYPIIPALEAVAVRESATLVISVLPILERINKQLAKARNSDDAIVLDTKWHNALISKCSNGVLLSMIASLRRRIFRYERVYMSDTATVASSVKQHADIIASLGSGNIEAAIKVLHLNYELSMETVVLMLSAPTKDL